MPEDLLEFDESQIKWTDKEIFTGFISRPKATFKYVIENYYNKYVVIIMILYGCIKSLEKSVENFQIGVGQILINLVLGGLFSWIIIYIFGGIYLLVGRIFKSQADIGQLVRVISYAFIPILLATLFKVVVVGSYRIFFMETGSSIGNLFPSETSFWIKLVPYVILLVSSLGSLYTLVLLIVGVAEASKVNLKKGAAIVLIPFIFILILGLIAFLLTEGFG